MLFESGHREGICTAGRSPCLSAAPSPAS